jgi:hypothetical protein
MSRSPLAAAIAALVFVIACTARSEAQSWNASFLAGYTPDAGIDRQAPELDALDISGGFTWGASASRSIGRGWAAEIEWTQQQSGLELGIASGSPTLFEFTARDLHGNAVYHLAGGDARLQPFVFAGAGATFFNGGDQPSETKFSWAVGGGIKYFPWRRIGVRGQARYKPVVLADEDAGDFCDPFGFCQGSLNRFDLAGGVVVRF